MNLICQRTGLKICLTGSIETESRHGFLFVIQGMTIFLLAQSADYTWDLELQLSASSIGLYFYVSQASEVLKEYIIHFYPEI